MQGTRRAMMAAGLAAVLAGVTPAFAQTAQTGLPAYWIARVTMHDAEAFEREFVPRATAVFAAHGGVYVARGGQVVTLEGEAAPRVVVLRFPSVAAAQAAYASPEYKAARKIADRYATFETITVVEALP